MSVLFFWRIHTKYYFTRIFTNVTQRCAKGRSLWYFFKLRRKIDVDYVSIVYGAKDIQTINDDYKEFIENFFSCDNQRNTRKLTKNKCLFYTRISTFLFYFFIDFLLISCYNYNINKYTINSFLEIKYIFFYNEYIMFHYNGGEELASNNALIQGKQIAFDLFI